MHCWLHISRGEAHAACAVESCRPLNAPKPTAEVPGLTDAVASGFGRIRILPFLHVAELKRTISPQFSAVSGTRISVQVEKAVPGVVMEGRPPAEAEAEYYARLHAGKHTGHT